MKRHLKDPIISLLRRVVPLVLLAAGFAGCSEEPTEKNSLVTSLPLADVTVRDTVIGASSAASYRQFLPMDGRNNNVGRFGNYTAIAALQFYQSTLPARDTALVYGATLFLRMERWAGSPNGQLAFTVHRIQRAWSPVTLTWDTVQTAFYDPAVRGTYTGSASADTLLIAVDLDTAMVREWLRSVPSGPDLKHGIVLIPTAGSSLIRGFRAFDYDSAAAYPTLRIIAGSPTGSARDTARYPYGIDAYVGNIDNLTADPTLLYCQGGVDYRTLMKFSTDFIPRGAIINKAELRLQRDPVTSLLTKFSDDSSAAASTAASADPLPLFDALFAPGTRLANTPYTYTFDITRSVQAWVKGPNYGLVVRVAPPRETLNFDLLTFFSPKAPANLQPRLRLLYSIPK